MVNQFRIDAGSNVTVTVHQRTDSKSTNWHVHIKFQRQKPVRKSLNTPDREEAKREALKLTVSLIHKLEQGYNIHALKFTAVADMLINSTIKESELESEPKMRKRKVRKASDYASILNRWHKKYFKDKMINQISRVDIQNYKQWRKGFWITGDGADIDTITYQRGGKTITRKIGKRNPPTAATLLREDSVLRTVFSYALEHGHIAQHEVPHIKKEQGNLKRRPAFSIHEQKKLLDAVIPNWINKTKHQKHRRQRFIMGQFVAIMLSTGLRPGEAMNLKWKHVDGDFNDNNQDLVTFYIDFGKTGFREVTALPGTLNEIEILHQKQKKWCIEHELPEPMAEDYIFCNEYGQRIKSFDNGFMNMLNDAGILLDPKSGDRRVIYSLRHTYATVRLLNGVSVYTIAKNMGTSVQMIEKHYGHTSGPEEQAQLIKTIL